ncbi:MAG TPA: hypothetical protein VGJ75_23830 [Dongiaceae bacterium]|jgi:opacity protein-like surface antigen
MRNLLLIAATATLLAACAAADDITEETDQALQARWTGRSADDFVSQYGLPQGEYQLQNGDTLLAWGDRQNR